MLVRVWEGMELQVEANGALWFFCLHRCSLSRVHAYTSVVSAGGRRRSGLFGGEHLIEAGKGHGLLGNWQRSAGNAEG